MFQKEISFEVHFTKIIKLYLDLDFNFVNCYYKYFAINFRLVTCFKLLKSHYKQVYFMYLKLKVIMNLDFKYFILSFK